MEAEEKKKNKYGVVYLSYIPTGLNVKILREIMEDFGEVGKIYLEPEGASRKRYVEGWVEFKKKRVAKEAAKTLNGTTLQYGRKRSILNGQIWSVKYLHKFKWAHLTEQLRHDRAEKEQRRRFEMTQTKKNVEFYQKMSERSKRLKSSKSRDHAEADPKRVRLLESRQNKPISGGQELSVAVDEDLLSSIFKKTQ